MDCRACQNSEFKELLDGDREGKRREEKGEQRAKRGKNVKREDLIDLFNMIEKMMHTYGSS